MSSQDWLMHIGRLNYYAGQLSQHGTYHVACAQARELADAYEQLVRAHNAMQLSSPTMDLGAFMEMATVSEPRSIAMQPIRRASTAHSYVNYTTASPCPDAVAPSGTSKGKKKAGAHKPLPEPPTW